MPSSHANSLAFLGAYTAPTPCLAPGLAFLGAYTALALVRGAAPGAPLSAEGAGAAAVLALSLFLTWLRVRLGFHTVPQVLVGYGLGAATALAWHSAAAWVIDHLAARPEQRLAVYGATAAAMALFALRNVLAWVGERRAGHAKAA
ncbi:hypothetical protein TSOC_005727 [Tetrabaena socialis]|uniref:Phosphatidic acid phosphatase type 2/haloperoxidase domain-containing protein n=1 Tax=Tetrabaena socialis TaxID=47790 RepID=A0A2J8A5K8_9CHLO|nr:hypothetical protein TSOC_005727 [Tetrabaena socialis]|eukprot:PNH07790.1 hypothetical protein TSOC_005727 [Tetrabaena socialis]